MTWPSLDLADREQVLDVEGRHADRVGRLCGRGRRRGGVDRAALDRRLLAVVESRHGQLRHHLVEAEAERQRADDVARDVEQVEVDLRLRAPRQARVGRISGPAVGGHADLRRRVGPRRRLRRRVVLAEQPLRGRARLEEQVAELRRAAAGRDALRQAHAHALQRAVVRAVDALALGQCAVQRDRRRERVAGRVDRRDIAEVDLLRRLIGRPDARRDQLHEAELGLDAAGDRDVRADHGLRIGRVAPHAGDEDRARGRRPDVARGLLDPQARVGLEDVVEVRAVEIVDARDDAADLDVGRADAERVGRRAERLDVGDLREALRVLRAARRRVVVSRSKSASLSSVSFVPSSLRTNALLPLTVGKTSPAFARAALAERDRGAGQRLAADGVDHRRRGGARAQLRAAVVGDAGRDRSGCRPVWPPRLLVSR